MLSNNNHNCCQLGSSFLNRNNPSTCPPPLSFCFFDGGLWPFRDGPDSDTDPLAPGFEFNDDACASLIAPLLRQKSICSFRPWLSVSSSLPQIGHSRSGTGEAPPLDPLDAGFWGAADVEAVEEGFGRLPPALPEFGGRVERGFERVELGG